MRERGADARPAAARRRRGSRDGRRAVAEADALEQRSPPRRALPSGAAPWSSSWSADRLRAREVGRERPRVVLVEERRDSGRGTRASAPGARRPTSVAEHACAPGGERVEAGDHAQQRRLAGAARPEHDDDLALLDPRASSPCSATAVPPAERWMRKASRTSTAAHSRLHEVRGRPLVRGRRRGTSPRRPAGRARARRRRASPSRATPRRDEAAALARRSCPRSGRARRRAATSSRPSRAPPARPSASEDRRRAPAAARAAPAGATPWASRSRSSPRSSRSSLSDADPEAEHREREGDERGGAQRERRSRARAGRSRAGARPRRARRRRGSRTAHGGGLRRPRARRGAESQISFGVPRPGAPASIAVESRLSSASTNGPESDGTVGSLRATPTIRAGTRTSWKSRTVLCPTPPAAAAMSGRDDDRDRPAVGRLRRTEREARAGVREREGDSDAPSGPSHARARERASSRQSVSDARSRRAAGRGRSSRWAPT